MEDTIVRGISFDANSCNGQSIQIALVSGDTTGTPCLWKGDDHMVKMATWAFIVLLVLIALVGVVVGTMVKHPNETDHFAGDVIGSALGSLS